MNSDQSATKFKKCYEAIGESEMWLTLSMKQPELFWNNARVAARY
jgi:hypothetical protein